MKTAVQTEDQYRKDRNTYQVLASAPIWFSIIPLIGEIFVQSTLTLTENTYSDPKSLGLLFASAALSVTGASGSFNLSLVKSLSAGISIGLALVLILLSSYALKGKGRNLLACFFLYLADSLVLIPLFVTDALGIYGIRLTQVDIVLYALIHLLGLAVLFYAAFLEGRIARFEKAHPSVRK
jgi:hypothetical protein